MALKPIPYQDQVQRTCQVGLTVLSDEKCNVPGNMVEGILSFKTLLSGILNGSIILCQAEAPEPEVVPDTDHNEAPEELAEEADVDLGPDAEAEAA